MARPRRRSLRAVAFASFVTLLGASGAAAQDTNTIGPPQLRDFQLPGQRTTPPADPAPTTTAAPPATAPARTSPKPPAADAKPRVAAAKPAPPATPARAPAPAPAPASSDALRVTPAAPAPAPARSAPAPALPAASTETAPPPVETRTPPPPIEPAPSPAALPPASTGFSWWWLLLPLLAGAGALLFLRRRRRPQAVARDLGGALFDPPSRPQPGPVAEPTIKSAVEPEPEPAAAPVPETVEAPRAWLELDIVPERAAATENETIVNYELVLRNAGAAVAGNIRIEAQMFNAGSDGEIAEFFAAPLHARSGSPHVTIPPGEELRLGSAIRMSNAEVRTIEVQGRAIFVPMIAATVAYDWSGGTGRSSKSWLVGREAETPAAKMGAFRLDLGPRIYRQVGRREGKLEMV